MSKLFVFRTKEKFICLGNFDFNYHEFSTTDNEVAESVRKSSYFIEGMITEVTEGDEEMPCKKTDKNTKKPQVTKPRGRPRKV